MASAASHILHGWVTSQDTATILNYSGSVLRQHQSLVHTDWLPGASSKVLPSSSQHFSFSVPREGRLILGRKTSTWQGSFMLCALVDHLSLSQSQSDTENHQECPLLPHTFCTGTQSSRKKVLQKRLNSLSDTHYFIPVFPLHF